MNRLLFLLITTFTSAAEAASCNNRVCNPLNDAFSSVPGFVAGLAKVTVILMVPLVASALVYSGFLFVKARGKSGELATAKNNFLYVMVGATLILGAWVFASMLWGTIGQVLQSGSSSGTSLPSGSLETIRI